MTDITHVRDLQETDHTLISDSQSINATLEHIGVEDSYGCLFVKTSDGAYTEVYGCHRSTPWLNARVHNLLE